MRDDRLRLIFTCCHPALAPARPGRADAAAARRADHRGDRPRVPGAGADHGPAAGPGQGQDPRRPDPVPGARRGRAARTGCGAVLAVVYLIFNEGYTASSGDRLIRADLCAEAIRLGRLLAELMPDEPEVTGPAGAHAAEPVPQRRPDHRGRRAWCCWPTRTAAVGPRADRRGPGHRPALPAPQPARAVPDPGGDQRGAQRRADRRCHRLARRSWRSTTSCSRWPRPGGGAAPGGRGGRGGRPGRGPGPGRRAWTWTAITCSTRSGPTCCGGSAGTPRRRPRTGRPCDRTGNAAERDFLRGRLRDVSRRP